MHCLTEQYFRHDPYLSHLAAFLQLTLRYLGSDECMSCLDKLRQAYMLTALNAKKAHSKHSEQKYDDVPNYKITIKKPSVTKGTYLISELHV